MRYRIRSADGRRVVLAFSMPERPWVILFLAIVSLVCLVLGLAFALSPANPGDSLRALSLTGFGLFCFSAIFLFSTAYTRTFPSRLVFENDAGQVRLFDHKGAPIGTVPYAGVSGFSICRSVDDRVTRHSFGMDLIRGGRWELYASRRKSRVEVFQREVATAVRLHERPVTSADGPSADDLLSIDRSQPGVLRVAWRRKAHPVSLIISFVVLLSFLGALVGMKPLTEGRGAYITAVAFGAFFLFLALFSLLRTIGERVEVRLGRSALDCLRRSALATPREVSLPFSQIASVDFSMSFSRIGTRILFLRPEEVERFVRYRQGTFSPSEVPGLISFLRGLPQIDVSALEPAARLALAELIREVVQGGNAARFADPPRHQ